MKTVKQQENKTYFVQPPLLQRYLTVTKGKFSSSRVASAKAPSSSVCGAKVNRCKRMSQPSPGSGITRGCPPLRAQDVERCRRWRSWICGKRAHARRKKPVPVGSGTFVNDVSSAMEAAISVASFQSSGFHHSRVSGNPGTGNHQQIKGCLMHLSIDVLLIDLLVQKRCFFVIKLYIRGGKVLMYLPNGFPTHQFEMLYIALLRCTLLAIMMYICCTLWCATWCNILHTFVVLLSATWCMLLALSLCMLVYIML